MLRSRFIYVSFMLASVLSVGLFASAQNINTPANFPDPAFQASVEAFMGSPTFTAAQAAAKTGALVCSGQGISGVTGVEFFTNITAFYCNNNSITNLSLTNHPSLSYLRCFDNNLQTLDLSGAPNLLDVRCYNNQLVSLDVSANTALRRLYCYNNQLTALDLTLNGALTHVLCQSNQLASLLIAPNASLSTLTCEGNQLVTLDVSNNTALYHLQCNDNLLTSLNVTNNSTLNLLYCQRNQLTSLDVSTNTPLRYLYCYENDLTSLNVTNNTALQYLRCYDNQLSSIDVSLNTSLQDLRIQNNNIQNVSSLVANAGIGAGDVVNVQSNQLNYGDSSDVLALQARIGSGFIFSPQQGINPYEPTLSSVDISGDFSDPAFLAIVEGLLGVSSGSSFTALQAEQITGTLNVSGAGIQSVSGIEHLTEITGLDCSNNLLTELDVSQNTKLFFVRCTDNQLQTLTLAPNNTLAYIYAFNNQLAEIDASGLTGLYYLQANNNALTNLVLTGAGALSRLYVYDNQLTGIDVSGSPGLQHLYCYNNALTSLNVTNNTALQYLRCYDNQLSSIDVSLNTSLQDLRIQNNNIQNVSSLVANAGIGAGDVVNVQSNQLNYGDSSDVLALQARIGSGFIFSPQQGINPYEPTLSSVDISGDFSDPAFLAIVEGLLGVSSGSSFTALQAEQITGTLNVSGAGIQSVSGIEHLTEITGLDCSNNLLTELDVSQNTKLFFVRCTDNQLQTLTLAPNNTLAYIYAFNNQLAEIDASGLTGLYYLQANNNALTNLVLTGAGALSRLYVYDNQLTGIDVSGSPALQYLYCYNNALTSLDVSGNAGLRYLRCYNNQITALDLSANTSLVDVRASGNQISDIASFLVNPAIIHCNIVDVRSNNLTQDDADHVIQLINDLGAKFLYSPQNGLNPYVPIPSALNINLGANFPDSNFKAFVESIIGVSPGGVFTASDAAAIAGTLNFASKSIQYATGIEYFTGITRLECANNSLKSLDLSSNIKLTRVYAANNQLKNLKLSGLSSLTRLYCENNQITQLDLTGSPSIQLVNCSNNLLSFLVVPDNNSLTHLYCNNNQLTQLDCSNNTALFLLQADNNNLVALDVTNAASLSSLFCVNNQLPAIDLSTNPALQLFYCSSNNLTQLSLGQNTGLKNLRCGSNLLTSLNLSANLSLKDIRCSSNQLVSLQLPATSTLTHVYCQTNQLVSLDASQNTGLFYLQCDGNQLQALNLSNASSISYVLADNNQLASINPPVTAPLAEVRLLNNQISSIASIAANQTFGVGDLVDVRNNVLSEDDLADIATLNQVSGLVFLYTLIDTLPPVFGPLNNLVVTADSASGSIVSFPIPAVSDIFDPTPTVVCSPVSGSLFPIGSTVVSCTAVDAANNVSLASFTITVEDQAPPVITLGGPASLTLECGQDAYDPSVWQAQAVDEIDGVVPVVIGGDVVSTTIPNVYLVTFDATDSAGNPAAQVTRMVTTQDTLPPVFSNVQDVTAVQSAGCSVLTSIDLSSLSVVDLCDASLDVTTSYQYPSGTEQHAGLPFVKAFPVGYSAVMLSATDDSQNSATDYFIVYVQPSSQLAITAKQIVGANEIPFANTEIRVYSADSGACAQVADLNNAFGIETNSLFEIYQNCPVYASGATNASGEFTVRVPAGNYLAVLWHDVNENLLVDADDTLVGQTAYGVACDETQPLMLLESGYAAYAYSYYWGQSNSTVNGDVGVKDFYQQGAQASSSANTYRLNAVKPESIQEEVDEFLTLIDRRDKRTIEPILKSNSSLLAQKTAFTSNPEVTIGSSAVMNGDVYGDSVLISSKADIFGDVYFNEISAHSKATIHGTQISPLSLPLPDPSPSLKLFAIGGNNLTVASGQTVTIQPGDYQTIRLNSGTQAAPTILRLEATSSQNAFHADSVYLGNYCQIKYVNPCEMRVKRIVYTGSNCQIKPDNAELSANDFLLTIDATLGGSVSSSTFNYLLTGSSSVIKAKIHMPTGFIYSYTNTEFHGELFANWIWLGSGSVVHKDNGYVIQN